ncbi:hypothetical protein [Campylobacter cuniculorum]|uniref:Lipoprotein n=2 Tax=Campylobacter cuniculorum TaxID=374106 RepID=A0ABX6TXL0_9BACT|nr:hypothetical protein [Campylobacter cuniculorum]ARJ56357.1 putative lipoprotein [Campylobacter cuniculorum DSM 23162 = LMG 24588]QOR03845.1 hypothetical protein A0071_06615 [Campylobacter cuniculorum]
MKKIVLFLIFIFLNSGCFVNERGLSKRLYSDCEEYYDASGMYHKDCPENWINFPSSL